MGSFRGFFGKLPARGDFVSAGLSRDFVSCWDGWVSSVLAAAVSAAGDDWLQAPAWHFCLAPGVCGAGRVTGVLLASNDKVGRRFPLTLAWSGDAVDANAAERLGRAAIAEALPPDVLAERLANVPELAGAACDGDDRRCPAVLSGLPDAITFATMMTRDAT
jgi:type VI secretion system protein ImpM